MEISQNYVALSEYMNLKKYIQKCAYVLYGWFLSEKPEANIKKSIGDGIFECEPCHFKTKYSQNYHIHFKSLKHLANTENLDLSYDSGDEFNGFDDQEPKIKKIRKSIGDGVFKCDLCNFETKYSQNLQAHFRSLKHLSNTDLPKGQLISE